MRVVHVVGARPNFVKIASIMEEMDARSALFEQVLVHTGQHYDENLSQVFFDDLGIPRPSVSLGIGSGSHAQQTASVMLAFEPILLEHRPDVVMVVGDVNSTLASALVASKLNVPLAHVEAGLRSFDRRMPEEVNRTLVDRMADLLFTTEASANENLRREGIDETKIHFVGNVMIDTLLSHRDRAMRRNVAQRYGIEPGRYGVLTLHRPSNVDAPAVLAGILDAVEAIQARLPVVFPAHPRTVKRIEVFGFGERVATMRNLVMTEPLGYLVFLSLMANARLVLTDSGGVQEETTILGVPCLTLRQTTERPVTLTHGTNKLVGQDTDRIVSEALAALDGGQQRGRAPELWDGRAAERIADVLSAYAESDHAPPSGSVPHG